MPQSVLLGIRVIYVGTFEPFLSGKATYFSPVGTDRTNGSATSLNTFTGNEPFHSLSRSLAQLLKHVGLRHSSPHWKGKECFFLVHSRANCWRRYETSLSLFTLGGPTPSPRPAGVRPGLSS